MKNNNIGIYYKDYNWAVDQFNFLVNSLDTQVSEARHNNKFFHIALKDGDNINIYPAGCEMHGHRHTHIYIQKGVDRSIYEVYIAPTFSPFKFREIDMGIFNTFKGDPVYVIENFRNIDNIVLATDYYYEGIE